MKKIEIPMFYTWVFYIEGNPEQLDRQTKSILKKYGFIRRNGETTAGLTENKNARTMFCRRDEKSTINIGNISKAVIIAINTESNMLLSSINPKVDKIGTISHEIRHVVDRTMKAHRIEDEETPAYLTGWLTREILLTLDI